MRNERRLACSFAGTLLALVAFAVSAVSAAAEGGLVGAQGRHFVAPDGQRTFVWGVNYVGHADRSWTMWEDGRFDEGVIGEDFERARRAGANVVRVFVRSPLQQEIVAGRWSKLDAVVAAARLRGLRLLVSFYDYAETDLTKVAAVNRAVAARYVSDGTVFGYDLRNEVHLSDLIAARYTGGRPPLLGDALLRQYGERVNLAQVNAWRQTDEGRRVIPAHLAAGDAYYAANGYRIYLEFVAAVGDWVKARAYGVSALDYLASPDSARWRPLLSVLDDTLAAWLQPQVAAVRQVDPRHLLTVGYNDPVLAQSPANAVLSFASLHRFPSAGAKPVQVALATLRRLQKIFPDKPLLLEEFGYPDAGRSPAVTALEEAALLLGTWSGGLAGGLKWSLNDVAQGWSDREQSFGLYSVDGSAKPAVATAAALAAYFASGRPGGTMTLTDDAGTLRFVYRNADALIVGGRSYQDSGLTHTSSAPIQVATSWRSDKINVTTTGMTTLSINPSALLGDAGVRPQFSLARGDGAAVPFSAQGDKLTFAAEPGERYQLKLSRLRLDAKVEVVWPKGNRPVQEAEQANIGAYVFDRATGSPFCGPLPAGVRLWRALNNEVEEPLGLGATRSATAVNVNFPAWDFDNVGVAVARDPANRYYFRLGVDGWDSRSNIWSHGGDARTYFPNPDVPTAVLERSPLAVDAKIEIVWPHDSLPVDKASRVNIVAYLFDHGTSVAVPPDWEGTVRLWRSLNNGLAEEVATGQRVLKTVKGLTFPAWAFDNVDVSAARETANKYYFRLTVDGLPSYSNVWSHGKDARTFFPKVDVPVTGCP